MLNDLQTRSRQFEEGSIFRIREESKVEGIEGILER